MNQKYRKIGSTPNKIESHFGLYIPTYIYIEIYIYIYLCVCGGDTSLHDHYLFQGCLNQAAIMGMDGVLLLMGRPCHTFSGRHSVTWSPAGVNNTPVGIYHQNPSANNRGDSRFSPPKKKKEKKSTAIYEHQKFLAAEHVAFLSQLYTFEGQLKKTSSLTLPHTPDHQTPAST